MKLFSVMIDELQKELKSNNAQIRFLLKKNSAIAYRRITEISKDVGKKYNVLLVVNFSRKDSINDFDSYATRDISISIEKDRKRFPINRQDIKDKAYEVLGDVFTEDSYMREGKEGVRVKIKEEKIDILPHSLHVWTTLTKEVKDYCDWLLDVVYQVNQGSSSADNETTS